MTNETNEPAQPDNKAPDQEAPQIRNLSGYLTLTETADELGIAEPAFRMLRMRMRRRGDHDPAIRVDRSVVIAAEWLDSDQADRIRLRREIRERQAAARAKKEESKKDVSEREDTTTTEGKGEGQEPEANPGVTGSA